jgi:hypothetical protein
MSVRQQDVTAVLMKVIVELDFHVAIPPRISSQRNNVPVSAEELDRIPTDGRRIYPVTKVGIPERGERPRNRFLVRRAHHNFRSGQLIGQNLEMAWGKGEFIKTPQMLPICFQRTALAKRHLHRQVSSVVIRPGLKADSNLAQIAEALSLARFQQTPLDSRQKQCSEDDDNGDDNKKLKESETRSPPPRQNRLLGIYSVQPKKK